MGNIPAYAGRTGNSPLFTISSRKHPRIRGENACSSIFEFAYWETSPHTRGEPDASGYSDDLERNIPAYAGRTGIFFSVTGSVWKHPRIRGENESLMSWNYPDGETSPHTRGELVFLHVIKNHLRNIPAYAGRTVDWYLLRKLPWKHPRIRGENQGNRIVRFILIETSPHTRGEHGKDISYFLPHRNIPAYAGRTENFQVG